MMKKLKLLLIAATAFTAIQHSHAMNQGGQGNDPKRKAMTLLHRHARAVKPVDLSPLRDIMEAGLKHKDLYKDDMIEVVIPKGKIEMAVVKDYVENLSEAYGMLDKAMRTLKNSLFTITGDNRFKNAAKEEIADPYYTADQISQSKSKEIKELMGYVNELSQMPGIDALENNYPLTGVGVVGALNEYIELALDKLVMANRAGRGILNLKANFFDGK